MFGGRITRDETRIGHAEASVLNHRFSRSIAEPVSFLAPFGSTCVNKVPSGEYSVRARVIRNNNSESLAEATMVVVGVDGLPN